MTEHIPFIRADDVTDLLSWAQLIKALERGHRCAKADINDMLQRKNGKSLLSRSAWVDGLGVALKSVTVFPDNARRQPPLPSVQGALLLFDEDSGVIKAVIDGALVTHWKTCADSLLGSKLLARSDASSFLMVGAGTVAKALLPAYQEQFKNLKKFRVWNRNTQGALQLASQLAKCGMSVEVVDDLALACTDADIISSATLSVQPLIRGEWIKVGTHVDLIGAYRADMREADDDLLTKADLYVDSRQTLADIGELAIPLQKGVIVEQDILGDFYDLLQKDRARDSESITVFKNGGGAHLDLMTGLEIFNCWRKYQQLKA